MEPPHNVRTLLAREKVGFARQPLLVGAGFAQQQDAAAAAYTSSGRPTSRGHNT
jgi:hypothetical protein